jgi:hypothetical protein
MVISGKVGLDRRPVNALNDQEPFCNLAERLLIV